MERRLFVSVNPFMQGMSGNSQTHKALAVHLPEHALHEKGLQKQIGVGTLVSSQEQRALFVPLINCCQTLVNRCFCSSVVFKYELDCSCFQKDIQESVFDLLEGKSEGCLFAGSTLWRPVLSSPALPHCSAMRRTDPTRPWCVRQKKQVIHQLASDDKGVV